MLAALRFPVAMTRHAFWLLLAVGCASPMANMRDDNRRLTQTVTELRTERRAQDRKLRDLQHQLDKLRADRVTAVIAAMPALPVEVLQPPGVTEGGVGSVGADGSRIVAIADDGTEIVYEGDAAAGKAATWGDDDEPSAPPPRRMRAREDGPEVTRRSAPVSARSARTATRERVPAPDAAADGAGDAYRAAVELVRSGSHAPAIDALRAFLRSYPRHDYADNAQYWLGEAHYAQKDYPHALTEFRTVIETYPRGNKVPDALLKVGYCYQALGQTDKARAVLEQVVNLYPRTEPAGLAAKRLASASGDVP